jgi:signal recognition particle subunit SEC65
MLPDLIGNLEMRIDRLVHKPEDETTQMDIPSSLYSPERSPKILELGAREISGERCFNDPSSGMQVSDLGSTGSDVTFRPQREVGSKSRPRKAGRKLPRRFLTPNPLFKRLGSLNSNRYKSRGMRITKAPKKYTHLEIAERYDFLKILIETEADANTIVTAYEAKVRYLSKLLKPSVEVQVTELESTKGNVFSPVF